MLQDDLWTPKLVGDQLIEALKWAQRAAGAVGPAGSRSGFPQLAFLSLDREAEGWPAIQEMEAEPMRRSLSPAKVSQMERVLEWPMLYLKGFKQKNPGAFRVFAVWVRCKLSRGKPFGAACDERGWSRATAYRLRDRVLSEIAQGLARDGKSRGSF